MLLQPYPLPPHDLLGEVGLESLRASGEVSKALVDEWDRISSEHPLCVCRLVSEEAFVVRWGVRGQQATVWCRSVRFESAMQRVALASAIWNRQVSRSLAHGVEIHRGLFMSDEEPPPQADTTDLELGLSLVREARTRWGDAEPELGSAWPFVSATYLSGLESCFVGLLRWCATEWTAWKYEDEAAFWGSVASRYVASDAGPGGVARARAAAFRALSASEEGDAQGALSSREEAVRWLASVRLLVHDVVSEAEVELAALALERAQHAVALVAYK